MHLALPLTAARQGQTSRLSGPRFPLLQHGAEDPRFSGCRDTACVKGPGIRQMLDERAVANLGALRTTPAPLPPGRVTSGVPGHHSEPQCSLPEEETIPATETCCENGVLVLSSPTWGTCAVSGGCSSTALNAINVQTCTPPRARASPKSEKWSEEGGGHGRWQPSAPAPTTRTLPTPGASQPSLQSTLETPFVSPAHWLMGEGGPWRPSFPLREEWTRRQVPSLS